MEDLRSEINEKLDKLSSSDSKMSESINRLTIEVTKLSAIMSELAKNQTEFKPKIAELEGTVIRLTTQLNSLNSLTTRVQDLEEISLQNSIAVKAMKTIGVIIGTATVGLIVNTLAKIF